MGGTFTVKRKLFRLTFAEGTEIEGAEVACYGLSARGFAEIGESGWVQEAAVPTGAELTELLDQFAECLVSWNLVEEDGAAIPPNADGVRTLGLDVMSPILAEWLAASQASSLVRLAQQAEAMRAEQEAADADAELIASLSVEALEEVEV